MQMLDVRRLVHSTQSHASAIRLAAGSMGSKPPAIAQIPSVFACASSHAYEKDLAIADGLGANSAATATSAQCYCARFWGLALVMIGTACLDSVSLASQ